MKNRTDARNHSILILAFAGLICSFARTEGPAGIACAQGNVPGWSFTGKLNEPRSFPSVTTLQDGRVLVAGGSGSYDDYVPIASAELYNPATGKWTITGSLVSEYDAGSLTLLADGRVWSV